MKIDLSSLFLSGLLLVVLIVVLVAIYRQDQNTEENEGTVIIPQNQGTVYVYQEPEAPDTIECSCVQPIVATRVGDMFDFDENDDWFAASMAYRPDNNTLYVSATSDNVGTNVIYPVPLDSFNFASPALDSGVSVFAPNLPFNNSISGLVWNATDNLFYAGNLNGELFSVDADGTWNEVAQESVYDDATRGYVALANGNLLFGDSPSNGGDQIYEIDPSSGDDPLLPINTYNVTYQGLPIEGISAMAQAPDGSIWVAIRENGYSGSNPTPVAVFVPGQTVLVETCFDNTEHVISAMSFDGDGRLWFMTGGNSNNPTSIYFVDPPPCPDPLVG